MRYKTLPALIIFLGICFMANTLAKADLPIKTPSSFAAQRQQATHIFAGRVVAEKTDAMSNQDVVFKADKVWKGKLQPIYQVHIDGAGACGNGYGMRPGEQWLVYAIGQDELAIDYNSRTIRLQNAQADLLALGEGKNAPPDSFLHFAQRNPTALIIRYGVLLLIASGIGFLVLRNRMGRTTKPIPQKRSDGASN